MHQRCDDTYGSSKGVQVQRVHKGCASVDTDTRVNGAVAVKVKHAIDRGRRGYTVRKASCPSLDIEG